MRIASSALVVLAVAFVAGAAQTPRQLNSLADSSAEEALTGAMNVTDLGGAKAVSKMTGRITQQEIKDFLANSADYHSYDPEPLTSWEGALKNELKRSAPAAASVTLARRFGFSPTLMRSLVEAWLIVEVRRYGLEKVKVAKALLRSRLLSVLSRSSRQPLIVEAVADGLDKLNECSGDDFNTILRGSRKPVEEAWLIADTATCGQNYVRAARVSTGRELPALIRLADYGSLKRKDSLPLYRWLTRPEQLQRIAPEIRFEGSVALYRNYARILFASDLTDAAVSIIEGLPPELRSEVISGQPIKLTGLIDGLPISITESGTDETLKLDLATAYALKGRQTEAKAILQSMSSLDQARRRFLCSWDPPADKSDELCKDLRDDVAMDVLVLEHFLNHPDQDPYPLAEVMFGASSIFSSPSPIIDELRCRVFADPRFQNICSKPGDYFLQEMGLRIGESEEDKVASADIDALSLGGFTEARAEFKPAFDRLLRDFGDAARVNLRHESVSAPLTSFAGHTLPPGLRSSDSEVRPLPKGVAQLPTGFELVRFERAGTRAAAISLSSAYDPTGEVSSGGYWVHLSDDGGKHWSETYYTGLSQYFPFVVKHSSRLPLLDRDALNIEVEIQEIDTASITYPPTGLAIRRKASGLYLRIQIADLSRDSDHDGFTDIMERHLLLDHPTGSATPFIVGSDSARSCGPMPPEKLALIAMLGRLLQVQAQAIVEPADRPAGEVFGPWTLGVDPGAAAPIFLEGDPKDFTCLKPNRLMIVYSDKDIVDLKQFTPDFHALALPPIVFNRQHDRGYVKWSLGWTGGTLRLRLVKGQWVFDQISGWIT